MRLVILTALLVFPAFAQDKVALGLVHQIKTEAFENSKVMEHLSFLTDWYGPRLSGSPEFKEAADWAVKRLEEYGLEKPHLEKWGPFGRSWSLEKYSVELLEPRYSLMSAAPLAWSNSTDGPATADVVMAPLMTGKSRLDVTRAEEGLQKFMDKYRGQLN